MQPRGQRARFQADTLQGWADLLQGQLDFLSWDATWMMGQH
jgi:hypothetical protein